MRNFSAISCLFSACNKSEENQNLLEELDNMEERVSDDLDQMQVMKTFGELKKLLNISKPAKG